MKIKSLLTLITLVTIVVACTPKAAPTSVPTMAPAMTDAMENMESTSAPTEVASATSAPLPSGNVFEVEISGNAFEENTITIKVGDTVTWTNHDDAPHTVVADDSSFKSGSLSNDATFSQTFETAGTFAYHCGIHSSMNGTVIVEP